MLAPYKVYPATSGGQRCIALLYKYLAEYLKVSMISIEANEQPEGKIKLETLINNSVWRYANIFLFFKLKKFIKKKGVTHLIIEHPYYGWLAFLLKRYCKIKLIIHSHNIEGERFKSLGKQWWRLLLAYEKWTHKQADDNFFITKEDCNYAITNWRLKNQRCHVITYGTELKVMPSAAEKISAKKVILELHHIKPTEKIILFNGILNYQPNIEAVDIILNHINPSLLKHGFDYKILICGKNPPEYFLQNNENSNIIFTGYVDDISTYFLAADVFINPIISGGGIKTKLVEALGYNLHCVSTTQGTIGIPQDITGDKLDLISDDNWEAFTQKIINSNKDQDISPSFFDHFYWDNIARKAKGIIVEHSV